MDVESWAGVATIVATLLTMFAIMSRKVDRLDVTVDGLGDELRMEMRDEFADVRAEMRDGIAGVRAEMRDGIAGVRAEMRDGIAGVRTEMRDEFAGVRTEMRDELVSVRTEMRDGFAKVGAQLTNLEQRTYDLSTRLPPAASRHTS